MSAVSVSDSIASVSWAFASADAGCGSGPSEGSAVSAASGGVSLGVAETAVWGESVVNEVVVVEAAGCVVCVSFTTGGGSTVASAAPGREVGAWVVGGAGSALVVVAAVGMALVFGAG